MTLPRARLPGFRRRIGVVFQDFRLIPHLSASDNIALPLRVSGVPEHDVETPVREMLAWVGLSDRANAKPPTLSGGEQQRIAIARAVIARPEMLVADEPTGNVDPDMAGAAAPPVRKPQSPRHHRRRRDPRLPAAQPHSRRAHDAASRAGG